MGVQSEAFLVGEADAWYERCRDIPRLPDPVLDAINYCAITPKHVVEIGCGDGWRLEELWNRYKCRCVGFDASRKAIATAESRRNWHIGYRLDPYEGYLSAGLKGVVDLFIFGFCLYVYDREDLFSLVMHTDEQLVDGGHIVIHDFFPDYPHKRPYKHKDGLWSYKQDYSKLWLGNPAYRLEHCTVIGNEDDRTGVAVLKKDMAKGWPCGS